jgi:hypothetical protein
MKFKWHGILIRESTRAEDLATAEKILKMRRAKLALEQERRLIIGGAAEALEALHGDIKSLVAKGRPVERALTAGQEKARKRIEKLKDSICAPKTRDQAVIMSPICAPARGARRRGTQGGHSKKGLTTTPENLLSAARAVRRSRAAV